MADEPNDKVHEAFDAVRRDPGGIEQAFVDAAQDHQPLPVALDRHAHMVLHAGGCGLERFGGLLEVRPLPHA